MDWQDSNKVWEMGNNLKSLSEKYKASREKAANAQYNLDIMLASKMPVLREKKANLGRETAVVFLLELDVASRPFHKDLLRYEAEYKSLERMMDAQNSQIMLAMSLAKNQAKQGG
jgi:hypothetical protein